MLKRRRTSLSSSFGPDGRRIGGSMGGPTPPPPTVPSLSISSSSSSASSSSIARPPPLGRTPLQCSSNFRDRDPGIRPNSTTTTTTTTTKSPGLVIMRAPIMYGLTCQTIGMSAKVLQPFRRPKEERRSKQKHNDEALKHCTLGMAKRMDGMQKIFSRSGRGLHFKLHDPQQQERKVDEDGNTCSESSSDEEEEDRPFEPLKVWTSPHNGGEPMGLPTQIVEEVKVDEFGIEMTVKCRKAAPLTAYSKQDVYVPPVLAKWLRPHQREGVQFMYECVMGLKGFQGNGCILADDMGLGKTLQSVSLIWTLLKTGITANGTPTAKRVIVVCPCSLVKNWDNEFSKWIGPGVVKTLPIAEADRKKVEKDLDAFGKLNLFDVLICSYECLRTHVKRLTKYPHCCDLLVCDEAHRLKNNDNQTSRALDSLPVKRRVLLTGTPMQNDLQEFYAMVNFTNPGILGSQEEFRKTMLFPILRGREPDATESQRNKMNKIQEEMSGIVNQFILRRINTLNAQHLPPKLVQVVCCNLTEIQQNMYQHLITSKDMQHVMDGKQVNCLGSIQLLMKLCNHPSLVVEDDPSNSGGNNNKNLAGHGRRASASRPVKYNDDDDTTTTFAAPGADGIAKFLPYSDVGGGRGNVGPIHPEWSGKMFVLYRLMKEMRKPGNGNDKIVIVSNYTQTLDLIGLMCRENSWGFCRLDGSVTMKKRQKMVDEFNDPSSNLIAFLLSSKAGGCGLNLIGGNRLVLFDPDWNPAVDKQAAARCWRDGQKKRCFTYRFLATGTVEEKIFQRQLSKEGLQSVVDDKEQVNALSTKDLRNLFKLRSGTPSDTHDKLRCERCRIIHDNAEMEAKKVLPLQLAACHELVEQMMTHEDAHFFLKPLVSQDHGVSKEDYEKIVKQPMDLGTIQSRLKLSEDGTQSYKNISSVSKDVNRIFANVIKVWSPGDSIADASRRLQTWWIEQWTAIVPRLMTMKAVSTHGEDSTEGCLPVPDDVLDGCATFHNERGDDYQEQIGMPDEENMRQWSHHHSTDTVDDPVFRAAMRGTDSVSFVFGLEVTWSLIQQRKQEEEDRKAMEAIQEVGEDELEALAADKDEEEEEDGGGEEEEDDNKDNGDVDEEETKDRHVRTTSEDTGLSSSGKDTKETRKEQDEIVSPSCLVSSTRKTVKKPSKLESPYDGSTSNRFDHPSSSDDSAMEDDDDDDDDDVVVVETMESPKLSSKQHSNSSHATDDIPSTSPTSMSTSSSSSSSSSSSPFSNSPLNTTKKEWQCSSCTLFNKQSLRKCDACGTRRPNQVGKRKRPLTEILS